MSPDRSPSSLADLMEIAPPPAAVEHPDWPRTEQALGSPLPSTYKLLVERYGCGRFGNHIRLFTPRRGVKDFDLVTNNEEYTGNMEDLWDGEPDAPEEIFEESDNKLVIWADTDDGDHLTWLVRPGQDPETWPVMAITSDALRWEYHQMSCIDFVYGVLTGNLESNVVRLPGNSVPDFRSLDL